MLTIITAGMYAMIDIAEETDGALAVAHPGEPCTIIVRPSVYPACVTHEVAHCLGWRHDNDKYNSMYCKD